MKIVALNKKEWVEEQFKSGLNCAQIVSLYFAEKYGYNKSDMIKVACGFGGGMRKGEVCGAVTGATMVIGMKYGNRIASDSESKRMCYRKTVEFEESFQESNSSIICRELLDCDISTPEGMQRASNENIFIKECPRLITSAIEILEQKGY